MTNAWSRDNRDYNFYTKVDINWSNFGENTDGYAPDVVIKFGGNHLMLLNENDDGVVEYSFNGRTVHGELDPNLPTKGLTFDMRPVNYIWFRVKSGSIGPIKVRIDSW